jgi:hypothetical protein
MSAVPHPYNAQGNTTLVSAKHFGKRSAYIWALNVNWFALHDCAIMNYLYG